MKKIFLTFLLLALFPLSTVGDTIFLKDGTKILTKKAWEENGLIKFYLKGSESIIITYSKKIIDRIEEGDTKEKEQSIESLNPPKPLAVAGSPVKEPVKEKEVKKKEIEEEKPQSKYPAFVTKKPAGAPSTLTFQNQDNEKSDGLLFYNPRRKHKYWTSSKSRYNTLEAAIAALSEKYGRSPEWVKANMGNTNSLYKIHKNLGKNIPAGKQSFDNSSILSEISNTLFYNPRRTHKYWASSKSRHNTLEAAIVALSEQYDRSPEWIKANMGNTNNLYKIHKNLANSKLNSPSN
ncbi:MAG: hypothetical protein B6I30_05065 [Desulfobacteraceae bacterium 4572_187]|nr:MAG: hypothetical protein B6I30_05065 [Desulfobacteraceae bacterium 4572_187]